MVRHSAEVTRPWFIRSRSRYGCNLMPASPAGWLLTGLYTLFAVGISFLLLAPEEPQPIEIAAWGVLLTCSTFAFVLTAWRTSEVRPSTGGCSATFGDWSGAVRPILIGLLTAALILGGALLGVDF
jgi:hypothetical protein